MLVWVFALLISWSANLFWKTLHHQPHLARRSCPVSFRIRLRIIASELNKHRARVAARRLNIATLD